MKIPQFALNGSYLTSTTGSSSHGNTSSTHGNGSSYLDSSSDRNNNNSPLLSPTPTSDDHKFMVDMAVAKDKTPFLLANKANDNLQRALNKFMVYHERERKLVNRMFLQEERIYKKRVARCATALPRNKAKTINTIQEERDHDEEDDGEGKWAITKKQSLSSPFTKPRPRTAGGPVTRHRIRAQLVPPTEEDNTVELTYTFNSLFGDVQKHVLVPSATDLSCSDNSDREDNDGDPLSGHVKIPTASGESGEASDCLTPIPPDSILSPTSRSSTSSLHPSIRRWSASVEAYSELERKRTSSGSINYGSDSGEEMGRSGVVPDNQQYVCENVFGNLSLQVKGDSRLNKVQVGAGNSTQDQGDYLEPPVRAGPRRSSISESAYRQLGRVRHYEVNREDSRRLSGCSDSLFSSSNTTLSYSHAQEPGMAVNKAISFLDRLDKYASSKRSKLHEGLVESVTKSNI